VKHGRFVNCVFCDDIRHEIGNKLSLMGIYQREMLVAESSLPTALPKLVAQFWIVTPIDKVFSKAAAWVVSPSGEEVARTEAEPPPLPASIPKHAKRLTLGLTALMSPFVITQTGLIEAWIDIDGETERAGVIAVRRPDGSVPRPT
jgi:hypothetical protein